MTADKKPWFSKKWAIALSAVFLLACAGGLALLFRWAPPGLFRIPGTPVPIRVEGGATAQPGRLGEGGAPSQMNIQLSEGQEQVQETEQLPLADGTPLSPEEIAAILARLPALPPASVEQVDFKPPAELLPPPRPGETVRDAFPPLETGTGPVTGSEAGPLQVLRYAPEGEIPIAPFISITFNQPMVPLTTLADLAARDVPVHVEPSLPGTWRWLGAKTLTFEYDSEQIDRLPKATAYRVTVPAGTKSLSGGVLAQEVTWTFTTPPPKVIETSPPDAPQPLEPLFWVAFDQRIDPAKVLESIQVYAGSRRYDLRLATEQELAEKPNSLRHAEGRWLAFKTSEALPPETRVTVTIGPGTPSAEGPLLTSEAQTYSFSTYAPLRVEEHGCSWYGNNDCPPFTPFYIRFNNPLDLAAFDEDLLAVDPEIPGATANAYGDFINIQGETRGRTTYTVTVSGKLKDVFGQELGKDVRLTFRVGPAAPVLVGPGQNFVTLDPAAKKPVLSVYAVNYSSLDVKIYTVQPADWLAFKTYARDRTRRDNPPVMPGKLVFDGSIPLNLPADSLGQVDIDLAPYTQGGFGQFALMVTPPKPLIELDDARWRRESQTVIAWVQVTQIGLDAYNDYSQMTAWATDLNTGAPLQGVTIQPETGESFTTGADGTVRFPVPNNANFLTAQRGGDLAILPRSTYVWGDNPWRASPPVDSLHWFVFDDRAMYRPGEEVHLKGWIRRIGGGLNGDVTLPGALGALTYRVTDATGNELRNGSAQVNAWGGFDFAFTLPEVVNLGPVYINFETSGGSYGHSFQVQEFRRPEFEVTAKNETGGPYFVDGHAVVSVEAKYYAGGGLSNADVTWQVTTSPGSYSPPNWPGFTFGTWQPWWRFYDIWNPPDGGESKTETFSGKTGAGGFHYLRLGFTPEGDPSVDPKPRSVVAEASVMDVNRQAWASSTSLLVHPADLYIGLRTARYFVQKGAPMKVDFIVTDLDGNPVSGKTVEIEAVRLEWKYRNGQWNEEAIDAQKCTAQSAREPQTCEFGTPLGGTYQITARVRDDKGRYNQSRITRWVSGGNIRPARKVEQEQVTLIPDKETYQPGDVAEILVQSPFGASEGLLTVSREGTLSTERFSVGADGTAILRVSIEERFIPNLEIQVNLNGSAPRLDDNGNPVSGAPPRPAYAVGTLTLNIPPLARTLALEVAPDQDKLEPGGQTSLSVMLIDANGNPVADAEVAVVVVDEAILALTNYQMADPLGVFYSNRAAMLESLYARAGIILADPLALAQQAADKAVQESERSFAAPAAGAPMPTTTALTQTGGGGGPDTAPEPIRVRADFNPLAVFAPSVRTDSVGRATVQVKLPDNLTRYRVMAVAVDQAGSRFGTGESNLTARLPLMVRPSAPRFLNFGDTFELPVVLQNQTDLPMTVDVVARAANLQFGPTAGDVSGVRVTVPANDRVEVRFPASTVRAGQAALQIAAVSGNYADAATLSLPVYTPATSEAFATYGVIDSGATAQPMQYPNGVFPQYGGLEITTSSTALSALTDAVLYLVEYPYECSEQLASRILGIAALRDVLTAFDAEGLPAPEEMESAVRRDIERLRGMQNNDGGFPYWQRGYESNPFNTIHVTHALVRARQKGYDAPDEIFQRALAYLKNIENYYPNWYSERTRRTLSAYALYVRNLAGDRDTQKAENLLRDAGLDGEASLSLDAIGWLWPVIENETRLEEIRRYVGNRVVETAGAANFTTAYDDQTYLLLSSNRRTDAILLDALMEDNPNSDLIPKVVNGLLAHRTKGRWGNTQENVFVLLALDRYFNTYEAQTPDFVARIWLGETYAGSGEFRGRSTERREILVPMSYVLAETAGGMQDLIISKDGAGRLYYRLGLRYAPTDLNLPPLDMGFVVQRAYEGVDNPEDVYKDAQGRWHIKAGARVRVKLTMVADNRRYHVALVDPLPAGLEIVNPALAVSGSVPQDPADTQIRYGWWWWRPWYEHQNLRDNRAEAFASLLWDGVYQYSYIARATTPGTFIVPPAKAEEMYSPEVFGRSASDWVIVE
jgi:uncharacterized protein YfaS (alpha-2-macroglobulin family)